MIYTRVDTYSVMLYHTKIDDILKVFGIDIDFKTAFEKAEREKKAKSYKKNDVKLGDKFIFAFNGLRFECDLPEYNAHKESNNIFIIPFNSIRFYISSSGVNYIESISNKSLQLFLSDYNIWDYISSGHKVTRCDFCFDYINYEGNEFERLRKIIANADFDDRLTEGGRFINGNQGGISYSYRGGSERTIYFGADKRILRMYDKKFQLTDRNGCFDNSTLPKLALENEVTIDSWHRVEFQCRDPYAERYLISCCGNWELIMGEIAHDYDVRYIDGKHIAPLHKIFLWTKRTPIIQNAKCTKYKSLTTAKETYVKSTALSSVLCTTASRGGVFGLVDFLNESTYERIHCGNSEKAQAFINKCNSELGVIARENNLDFDAFGNLPGLYKGDDGGWYIRKDTAYVKSPEVYQSEAMLFKDFVFEKYPHIYTEFKDSLYNDEV